MPKILLVPFFSGHGVYVNNQNCIKSHILEFIFNGCCSQKSKILNCITMQKTI